MTDSPGAACSLLHSLMTVRSKLNEYALRAPLQRTNFGLNFDFLLLIGLDTAIEIVSRAPMIAIACSNIGPDLNCLSTCLYFFSGVGRVKIGDPNIPQNS